MKICLLSALSLLLVQCVRQPAGPLAPVPAYAGGYSQQPQPTWQPAPPPQPVAALQYPVPTPVAPPTMSGAQPSDLFVPVSAHPHNGWQRSSAVRSQPLAGGAELHEFTASNAEESAEVTIVVFDSQSCKLRVLDQPSASAGSGVISQLMRSGGAVAGVNGGFFHPDFSTLGLMITDGRKVGQFTRTGLISGAVLMKHQEPRLVWNHEFQGESGVSQMLQTGPRLVEGGRPVGTLNATKDAARTFVATDGHRRWAIGTVRSTSLAGLGSLLASEGLIPNLQVNRALNLDGGTSTAFYARKADGQEISKPGWKTVRNYLAVIPR